MKQQAIEFEKLFVRVLDNKKTLAHCMGNGLFDLGLETLESLLELRRDFKEWFSSLTRDELGALYLLRRNDLNTMLIHLADAPTNVDEDALTLNRLSEVVRDAAYN